MICAKHDWWDAEISCPQCAAAAAPGSGDETVTAAETPESDLVSVTSGCDLPDIPDFLLRAKDGTFLHPRVTNGDTRCFDWTPNKDRCPEHRNWSEMTDVDLYAALDSSELTLVERQPIYQELRHREDRKKSLPRIAAMKEKKASAT